MERFNSKYIKRRSGCWQWIAGSRGKTGYGAFRYKEKVVDAHRFSYMLNKGYIPEGFLVCHKCNNRLCVNPDHLILGTPTDNHRDGVLAGSIKPALNQHLKKHPGIGAYRRGCRCSDCVTLMTAKRGRDSENRRQKKKMLSK